MANLGLGVYATAIATVRRPTNLTLTTGTVTAVDFTTNPADLYDPSGLMFSTAATDRLTVRSDGHYLIDAELQFAGNATGTRIGYLSKIDAAGTESNIASVTALPRADGSHRMVLSAIAKLLASQAIRLRAYQNSGNVLDLVADVEGQRLSVLKLR